MDIVQCAIGDRDGEIEFNVADDPMYSSLANLNGLEFASTKSTIVVPLRTLDNILRNQELKEIQHIRLLKLDVEGAEIDVIQGAEDSINARSLDYIYIEVHEKQIRLRGQNPNSLNSLLVSRGFRIAKQLSKDAMLYESKK